jgi:hypothetical protein
VDGEVMADVAVSAEAMELTHPFSALKGGANVLIFPDLNSANIAYKLLARLGGAETLGPILMGMSRAVHVLSRGAEVEEIVNVSAIAVGGCPGNRGHDIAHKRSRKTSGGDRLTNQFAEWRRARIDNKKSLPFTRKAFQFGTTHHI